MFWYAIIVWIEAASFFLNERLTGLVACVVVAIGAVCIGHHSAAALDVRRASALGLGCVKTQNRSTATEETFVKTVNS